jgi:hypothetical protein
MSNLAPVRALEGFKHNPSCKICSSKDKYGNPLRDEIEALRASGYTWAGLQTWLGNKGIYASVVAIANHFKKHASYAQKGTVPNNSVTKRMVTTLTAKNVVADEALRKIISVGNQMIDNWIEGKDGPQMPVTSKLFIEAIVEQGRRAPKTSMDVEFEGMEKGMIEGEEVKE